MANLGPTKFHTHHCPWKFHKFHRKTPVLESLFKKVAGLQAYFMFVFLYTQ